MERGFHQACPAADIPNGRRKALHLLGTPLVIFNLNKTFVAVRNRCTHLDFPLDDGRQIGFELICSRHGARFDLRTGRALGGPAVHALTVYPTRVVEGMVEVALSIG